MGYYSTYGSNYYGADIAPALLDFIGGVFAGMASQGNPFGQLMIITLILGLVVGIFAFFGIRSMRKR